METSATETGRLGGELSLVRKPGYDYRPVALGTLYLILYLALDWIAELLGAGSGLNHWHFTAGLSLGLLLMQDSRYAAVVLLAGMVDNMWLHPQPGPFPFVALNTVGMTLIPLVAALAVRRVSSGSCVSLTYGRDVVKFMAAAAFATITLAMVAAVNLVPGGLYVPKSLLAAFQTNLIGFAVGIFSITPFLMMHAGRWLDTFLLGNQGERPALRTYLETLEVGRPTTLFALSYLGMASGKLCQDY